jgi:hypothetical protein
MQRRSLHNTVYAMLFPAWILLALPASTFAADRLLTLESPSTQQRMLHSAGPALQAALKEPEAAEVVLARANANVVSEQSEDIEIELPDGLSVNAHKLRLEKQPDGISVWHGELPGRKAARNDSPNEIPDDPLNEVTLVRHNGNITGLVRVNGDSYEIRPVENGEHAIIRIDPSKFPGANEDDVVPIPEDASVQPPVKARNSTHTNIRVAVVISNRMKQDIADVPGRVALAFALANEGNDRSQVPITFEDAGIFDPNYTETADSSAILSQLKTPEDLRLGKAVHAYREAHRADLVAMLVWLPDVCGRGYLSSTKTSAFTVTDYGYCITNLTFGHEIGHNMGVHHGRTDQNNPPYAHGYQQGQITPRWRTIMAYECSEGCPRQNAWSNPRITYNGLPMGTAQYEDATRRLDERRETVANFYPPPGTAKPPVASAIAQPNDVSYATRVTLNGSGSSNPGGGTLRYAWNQVSGPALTIDNASQTTASVNVPTVNADTTYTFQLVVTNADDLSDSKQVTVIARTNSTAPPEANITGPATVAAGQTLTLSGTGSTGSSLSYQWTATGFTPSTSTSPNVSLTAPASTGNRAIQLKVTDSYNRTNTASHTVNVITGTPGPDCNGVPAWDSNKTYATNGEQVSYLGNIYKQNFWSVNKPPDTNSAAYGKEWIHVAQCEGGGGGNPAPQAKINGNSTVPTGQTLTLSGTGSTGTGLRYAWSAPGFTPASSTSASVSLTAPATPGSRSIQLTVTDNANRTSNATHTVNVTAGTPGPGCGNVAAWNSSKTYSTYNEQVSYLGKIYKQNFWNINKPPDTNSAAYGKEWIYVGDCQ